MADLQELGKYNSDSWVWTFDDTYGQWFTNPTL
jgi:hypothetical protein